MTKVIAYYKPRDDGLYDEDDEDDEGWCEIVYYNGFDFYVSMRDFDVDLIAQIDELFIDGVSVEKLVEDGIVILPEMAEDSIQVISSSNEE